MQLHISSKSFLHNLEWFPYSLSQILKQIVTSWNHMMGKETSQVEKLRVNFYQGIEESKIIHEMYF